MVNKLSGPAEKEVPSEFATACFMCGLTKEDCRRKFSLSDKTLSHLWSGNDKYPVPVEIWVELGAIWSRICGARIRPDDGRLAFTVSMAVGELNCYAGQRY